MVRALMGGSVGTGAAIVALAYLAFACSDDADQGTTESISEVEAALINGSSVGSTSFSVHLKGCSGSVIHPRVIVTAGHCSYLNAPTMQHTTVVATQYLRPPFEAFSGNAAWYRLPSYNNTVGTDVAVVVLPKNLMGAAWNTNGDVRVDTIPIWAGAVSVGDYLGIYGWGAPNETKSKRGVLTSMDYVSPTSLTTIGELGWARVCDGDSGGAFTTYPTYEPTYLTGVISRIEEADDEGCAPVGAEMYAHRLSATADWVRSFFYSGCIHQGDTVPFGSGDQWLECQDDITKYVGRQRNRSTDKCMDATNNSNRPQTPVTLYTCDERRSEQWMYIPSTGAIRFRADVCVDVQWGNFSAGTPVWLWPCDGGAAQRWDRDNVSQRYARYRLRDTNLCLSAEGSSNGSPLTIQTCTDTNIYRQHWRFE